MSDEVKVRALLGPLLDRPVDVAGTEFRVDRGRITGAILRAGQEASATPKPGRQLAWLLAVAAGVLLVGGAAALLRSQQSGVASSKSERAAPALKRAEPAFIIDNIHGSVSRSEAGSTRALQATAQAPRLTLAGELWTGPSSGAGLWRDDGLRIDLSENTRVTLAGLRAELASKTLELLAGRIQCRATALGAAGGFSVLTADAVVRAQAAVFSVEVVAQPSSTRSCVRVETGQVVVEVGGGKQLLQAGGTWGCDAGEPREPSVRSPGPPAQPPKSREAGTLDEENRLFQAGLSSERSGDVRAAAESFRALLTRYPKSPLAGDAQRALQRVTRTPSTP